MLKTLTIKNYHCFKNFSIHDLSIINLIVGDNNIGKTSLLEFIKLINPSDSILIPINADYLDNVEKNWDLIQLTDKEDRVIEALQIINPNIERVGFTVSHYTIAIPIFVRYKVF